MDLTTLLIQIVIGVIGGNAAGYLNKAKNLGPLLNSILGAIGGVGAGQALGGSVTDMIGNATAGNGVAALVGGVIVPLIGGLLKKKAPA